MLVLMNVPTANLCFRTAGLAAKLLHSWTPQNVATAPHTESVQSGSKFHELFPMIKSNIHIYIHTCTRAHTHLYAYLKTFIHTKLFFLNRDH